MQESAEEFLKQLKKDLHQHIDAFKEKTRSFKVGDIEDIDKFFDEYLTKLFDNKTDQRIFDSIKTLRFLEPKHTQGCKALLDRMSLLEQMPKNAVVAEIGVDRGRFAERIYEVTQPKKLHLIDVYQFDYQLKSINNILGNKENIEIHRSNSKEAGKLFKDEYFDWIYIDTDHTYETTKAELNAFSSKIKPGGFISGHDYFQVGISNGFSYGVMSAVHEFVVINNWKLYAVTLEPLENQSFVIQKPDNQK
jgi:hypothetical protein